MKRRLLTIIAVSLLVITALTLIAIYPNDGREHVITEDGVTWYTDTKQPQLSNPTPVVFVSDEVYQQNQTIIDSLTTVEELLDHLEGLSAEH